MAAACIILVTTDLVVASKLSSLCTQNDAHCELVRDLDSCRRNVRDHQPDWVVIDLDSFPVDADGIARIRSERGGILRIVAFGPHVHEQKLEAARLAGCDLVWTRGQIHRDFATLLSAPSRDVSS